MNFVFCRYWGQMWSLHLIVSQSFVDLYTVLHTTDSLFISGGPGSKKGKMVYDIAKVFGFSLLNVESIILEELAKKLEEPDPCRLTAQIHQLMKVRNKTIQPNTC